MIKQLTSPLLLKQSPLIIQNGALECLKWLALIAMLSDHTNKILLGSQLPFMSELGRIAMPLFGFVLAYNLARPDVLKKGIYSRILSRMCIVGVIAQPFYKVAFGNPHWIPLNIMFTLMLATGVIYLLDKGGFYRELVAIAVFILGGLFVDYLWFGVGYCLAAWYYQKSPNFLNLVIWLSTTASLYMTNENHWALAVIPIIFVASKFEFSVPRSRVLLIIKI